MVSVGQVATELEQEIASLTKRWEIEREIVRRYIDKAQLDDIEYKIMVLRYVDCLPFRLIQKRVGYERTKTFDYHKTALTKCGL